MIVHYKNEETPTNDLYIFIYRIAGMLKAEGLTADTYTKHKAKYLVKNTAVPSFCIRMIDNHSNEIIKNL